MTTIELPATIERPTPRLETSRDTFSPRAMVPTTPTGAPPEGTKPAADHSRDDTQTSDVGGTTSGSDQQPYDAQSGDVAAGTDTGQPARGLSEPIVVSLADPTLALAADVLDDLEAVRIANENRLRQLTRDETDSDGEERGFGLDATHPDVAKLEALVKMLADAEHQATLNLNRVMRRHPLGPWVKAQKGVGEKTAARLLAIIGDPYVNMQTGEVRTVSQLWAYAGHGDPARKLRKGMTQADLFALGNPTAKKRTWLIATAILKAGGGEEKAIAVAESSLLTPSLASAYYARKRATEGRLHATECKRCGPSGKPAQPGSPWSDAHRHADALRITGKEFLRGLWIEAKRIHETTDSGQAVNDAHRINAAVGTTSQEAQS